MEQPAPNNNYPSQAANSSTVAAQQQQEVMPHIIYSIPYSKATHRGHKGLKRCILTSTFPYKLALKTSLEKSAVGQKKAATKETTSKGIKKIDASANGIESYRFITKRKRLAKKKMRNVNRKVLLKGQKNND